MVKATRKPPRMIHGVVPPTSLTVTDPVPGYGITPGRDSGTAPEDAEKLTAKSRRWIYTLNNYTPEEVEALTAYECVRHIAGKEVAPTTGTPHLQGYMRFSNSCRKSTLVKAFPRASFRVAKGNDTENFNYCSKEGNVAIDIGVNCDESIGKLSRDEETDMIVEEIEKGAKYGQIRQRHKRFCFWHRRNILDYMRDEKFLAEYPDSDPTV